MLLLPSDLWVRVCSYLDYNAVYMSKLVLTSQVVFQQITSVVKTVNFSCLGVGDLPLIKGGDVTAFCSRFVNLDSLDIRNSQIVVNGSKMPKTLRVLGIVCIAVIPNGITQLTIYKSVNFDLDQTDWPRMELPSSLLSLSVNYRTFLRLPRGLVLLEMKNGDFVSDNGCAAMPATLKHLSLPWNRNITDHGLGMLPHGLTHLNLRMNALLTNACVIELPRGLTYLHLNYIRGFTDQEILWLPQGLTTLKIHASTFVTDAGIKNLPRGLTNLDLFSSLCLSNHSVRQLPTGLKKLSISCGVFHDVAVAELPRGLLELILNNNTDSLTDACAVNLPCGLRKLRLCRHSLITNSIIPMLPRSINSFDIAGVIN
jgi:hypothetical protein